MSAIISLAQSLLTQVNPIILALIVIILSFASYLALSSGSSNDQGDDDSIYKQKNKSLSELMQELPVYSRKEVASHNHESDCWVIIDNFVYDLTPFIPRHPGGMSVLKNRAGQDCTMGFHGFQHPENAYTNLNDYLIGRLAKEEFTKWLDEEDLQQNWSHYKGAVYQNATVESQKHRKEHAHSFVGYLRNPIPIEMVHTHNKEKDCWIIINDKIYDVTHWAMEHPGGSIITSKPGDDVSMEFENFHGSNREKVEEIMKKYYVAPVLRK